MTAIPSGWTHVGQTSNADFYAVARDLLVVAPHPDCCDTEATARESLGFQAAHWRASKARGAVAVLMDRILEQDAGARAVYAGAAPAVYTTCFALIGETFFGQAVSAVFTGLARLAIPTRAFRSLDDALPWIRAVNAAHVDPLSD